MESIKLNLIPGSFSPTVHVSQYDVGRKFKCYLFDGSSEYTLSDETVTIYVRKPDGKLVTAAVTVVASAKYVEISTTQQMDAVAGKNICELKISKDSTLIGTCNFYMEVERDPTDGAIASESEIHDLQAQVNADVQEYLSQYGSEAIGFDPTDTDLESTNVEDAIKEVNDKIQDGRLSEEVIADEYDQTSTYSVGDYVMHDGKLYQCNTDIDTAETWNSSHWTEKQVSGELKSINGSVSNLETSLENKANIDGSYKSLVSGNLVSTISENDKTPYLFRTSGGSIDIGDREEDTLVGGSIAYNQLAGLNASDWSLVKINISSSGKVITFTSTVSTNHLKYAYIKVPVGHKILFLANISNEHSAAAGLAYGLWNDKTNNSYQIRGIVSAGQSENVARIFSVTTGIYFRIQMATAATTSDYVTIENLQLFDLTQMLGTTIADYIDALESGTPGAGVAFFKKLFNKPYYEYNTGALSSVKATKHVMVGFNAYNHATGKAKLVGGCLYQITGSYTDISYSTGETLTPDADGKFIPTYSGELTVVGGNGTDTCVHLVWDGERDGEFEEYSIHEYALDANLELRGKLKLDVNNKLYYDGDTYESDGTVTRKYGIVNLGLLDWNYTESGQYFYRGLASYNAKSCPNTNVANMVITKFTPVSRNELVNDGVDMSIAINAQGTLQIRDLNYSDTTQFAESLNGVYLIYEFATPTTEEAEPFNPSQRVDDWGTEEYVDGRSIEVPVGHDTKYPANLRAKLEMMADSPDGDGDYILRHFNGENVYTQLVKELPSAPSEDGTYVLKCNKSGSTVVYSWELET